MRNRHEEGAPYEERTSADSVHAPDAGDDTDKLGHVQDARHDQLVVVVETHCLEKGWRVVDQSVDADELLGC